MNTKTCKDCPCADQDTPKYRVVKKGTFRIWYEIYQIGDGEAFSYLGDNDFESLEAISDRISALQQAQQLPVLEIRDGKLVEVKE